MTQEGINVPVWRNLVFQQCDRQDSRNLYDDTFSEPPVKSAQSIIVTEKYPDAAILLKYEYDDYSQGNGQIKDAFRALTKDDILKPFISDHDFRSTIVNDDGEIVKSVGYILHLFDKGYQKFWKVLNHLKYSLYYSKMVLVVYVVYMFIL